MSICPCDGGWKAVDAPYTIAFCKDVNKIRSKVTSKFQVTVPREIRERLKLGIADVIEWHLDEDGIRLDAVEKPFLDYQGYFAPGKGRVEDDIKKAWEIRAKRYQ